MLLYTINILTILLYKVLICLISIILFNLFPNLKEILISIIMEEVLKEMIKHNIKKGVSSTYVLDWIFYIDFLYKNWLYRLEL